ncbi:MAG: glycosyltransferase, partial [Ignavibacteriaceae bacterium]
MKVLIVCSGNAGYISPFIIEQSDSIKKSGIEVQIYPIIGKGIVGYLSYLPKLKNKIKEIKPDLIHAHYGLSGLAACMQRKIPVIITFHGSDAYLPGIKLLSQVASRLSAFNIFVEDKIKNKINFHKNNAVIPCGLNFDIFYPMSKNSAREKSGLDKDNRYALFSSRFENKVKNYSLAKKALEKIDQKIELIELKGKTREEVNLLLNACDLFLLTSTSEGSPLEVCLVSDQAALVEDAINDVEGAALIGICL